jgi:dienelactone hydrolase
MKSKIVDYQCDGVSFKGQVFDSGEAKEKRPVVLVAHAWKGCDSFALNKAQMLADAGYIGFALDLYGDGKVVETNEEALELMMPLFLDRKVLRKRIVAGYHAAQTLEGVDSEKMGAIGFCFGGASVIELLRSGVDLNGVVSFHGLLGNKLGDQQATTAPTAERYSGSLLILHGYQDPMVSNDDIHSIQNELNKKISDWQMHIYGSATHAFTNPEANDQDSGLLFHAQSEQRAIGSMHEFLKEVFK